MRIKRGREERAKFLELEKERRALEEERLKHEAEKRKWEQEKRAWEAEKKAVEDEKKKRLYQQEVIAARKRRESQMFKVGSSSNDLPEIEPQTSRRQGSYSRPAYDSFATTELGRIFASQSRTRLRGMIRSTVWRNLETAVMHSAPPPSRGLHIRLIVSRTPPR
jgi:hypothetical protein